MKLADLKDMTDDELRAHIAEDYNAPLSLVAMFDILVAYESVGNYGCDSAAYFLLREKNSSEYFEVHASRCSCFGFEDQFEPESCTLEYLNRSAQYINMGGYDDHAEQNEEKIREYLRDLK